MGLFKNDKKKETVEEAFETPCRPPSRNRPRPNRNPRPEDLDFHVEMVQKIDNLLNEKPQQTQPVVNLRNPHNRPKQPSALSAPQPMEFTASIPDGTTAPFRFCNDFENIETMFTPSKEDRVEVIDLNSIMNASDSTQPATASKKIHFNFPNKKQTEEKNTKQTTDENTSTHYQEDTADTIDAASIKEAEKQRKIEEKRKKAQQKKQAQEAKKAQKTQEKNLPTPSSTTSETKPGFFSNIFAKKEKTTETPMPQPRPLSPDRPAKPYDRTNPLPPPPQRPYNTTETPPKTDYSAEQTTPKPYTTKPTQQPNTTDFTPTEQATTQPPKEITMPETKTVTPTPQYTTKTEQNTASTNATTPAEATPTLNAEMITDDDVKYVLLRTDELLGNLPQSIIEEFAQSDDFKVYSKVMKKIKEAQH